MEVLKVTLEGVTASFRRPHFMLGVQPTFAMPPPTTIYGHICSALGDLVDPTDVRFAYHFTAEKLERGVTFLDLEHTHVLAASGGKLKDTAFPKVLEGPISPFQRELMFHPRLELYLNRPRWAPAFRSPRYAVALGRSQDLAVYTKVETITLEQADQAYFEHALLPYDMSLLTEAGTVELMPRFLDYSRNRYPTFARYHLLDRRVHSDQFVSFGQAQRGPYWTDPATTEARGQRRGLVFLSFTGNDHETLALS